MDTFLTIAALIGFFALTAGTAVFVAAEFSLTTLERSTVDTQARDGDWTARRVQKAHRTLSFQLSGAQLGITLTTLVTGYIAEPVLADLFAPLLGGFGWAEGVTTAIALALALFFATSLSMVLGELVPKSIAIVYPMRTARATAAMQTGFSALNTWPIRLLNGTANMIVRRLGIEPAEELRSARSPQELGSLVRMSAKKGSLDLRTAAIVDRTLEFGERTAEELMTPRVKIVALQTNDTVADLIECASKTGFSRFPVIAGDLDDTIGIVHVKQAFTVPVQHRAATRLSTLARKVPVVPAALAGDVVLERVRAHGMQMALVVDEYGGTAGIVTMEDVIEEILGDVRDEHDEVALEVTRIGDSWSCSGLLRIDEVSRETGYSAPDGWYETLGGLVLTTIGRIPVEGDEVVLPTSIDGVSTSGGWVAKVLHMDGRRIDRVLLTPVPESELEGRDDE
jgi:CBS domain containing-hemolysin-like protein